MFCDGRVEKEQIRNERGGGTIARGEGNLQ